MGNKHGGDRGAKYRDVVARARYERRCFSCAILLSFTIDNSASRGSILMRLRSLEPPQSILLDFQNLGVPCCTLRPQFWNVPELFREVYNSGDSGVPGLFLLAILVCTRIVTQAILVRTRIVREFLTCLPSVLPSFLRHMN